MAATVLTIADAVTAALNTASKANGFSQTFTAVRAYVPVYDLEKDLPTLRVTVVPKALSFKLLTRGTYDDFAYQIDVAMQQRLPRTTTAAAAVQAFYDNLMTLTEEIIDLFRGQPLSGVAGCDCLGGENAPIYDPELMDQNRLFLSLATLTFRLARARS